MLHCFDTGFRRVDLAGFDAPEVFTAQCLEELGLGLKARWTLQVGFWNAETVALRPARRGRDGTEQVTLMLDGIDATWRMVQQGGAIRVGGLSTFSRPRNARTRWCPDKRVRRLG